MRDRTLVGEGGFIVLHNVGLLLRYMALVPLLVLPVVAYSREWHMLRPVLLTMGAFLLAGTLLAALPQRREPRLREGLLVAAVSWLLVPLGSMIVLVDGEGWRPLDAYFECMSAWTGTGMSIAPLEDMSRTGLLWRSVMQWVGGLGVIVLTLAILARPGTGAFKLYAGEAREDKLRPSVLSTVRTLWKIYALLTAVGIGLLFWAGMPLWEAVNHGMTGIGTAGMSTRPDSIAAFDSPGVEAVLIGIMVAGSLPFVATYALLRGRWHAFVRDEQVRAMAFLLPLVVLALGLALRGLGGEGWMRVALFQGVSALTTTGFQTTDIGAWDEQAKLGLAGVMLLGGAAGSTAGGIKLVRGVLLVKGALWKLRDSGLPSFSVTTFAFGGQRLSHAEANDEFAEASFILVLWVATLFVALLVFLAVFPGQDLSDVVFEISSLQANVGLSSGIITPTMPDAAKAASVVLMWAGRLEVLPVLLLLRGLLPIPKR